MQGHKKYNKLTHFTFSILFVIYKSEEAEIRHEPSWQDKEQLPSLTSTKIVFFDEVHVQQVSGPNVTRRLNEDNIRFPRDEEWNIDVKNSKYYTKNQPKKSTFKYEQEGRLCLGIADIESKNGTITGKLCPVFDYSGKRQRPLMCTRKKYRNNQQEFESLLNNCHIGSKKQKQTRYGYVNLQVS